MGQRIPLGRKMDGVGQPAAIFLETLAGFLRYQWWDIEQDMRFHRMIMDIR